MNDVVTLPSVENRSWMREKRSIARERNNIRIVTPVVSHMLIENPQFVRIVGGFVRRLKGQLDALNVAIYTHDYEAIANIAHNLKGAGGSVGFDGFTVIAGELEIQAKALSEQAVVDSMNELTCYSQRVFAGWASEVAEVD
ncbi:MAG: Hpt domain-containing protein [Granulosicoccus sp.]